MRTRITLLGALILAASFSSPALARHHHHSHHASRHHAHRVAYAASFRSTWFSGGSSWAETNETPRIGWQASEPMRVIRRAQHVLYRATRALLSAPCALAARQGGPCGCFAEGLFFGSHEHVRHDARGAWNAWLARSWYRFPHVEPAPGTAAVWRHHVVYVAQVDLAHHRFLARDAYATHWRSMRGATFVRPS